MKDAMSTPPKVEAIQLPKAFEHYTDDQGDPIGVLEDVSQINILVGSNNSGKSRFMRMLASLDQYQVQQTTYDLESFNSKLSLIFGEVEDLMNRHDVSRINNEVTKDALDSYRELLNQFITLGADKFERIRSTFEDIASKTFVRIDNNIGQMRDGPVPAIQQEIRHHAHNIVSTLNDIPLQSSTNGPKRVYIPVLRGLRKLDESHTDFYMDRTLKDYFDPVTDVTPEVFTGLGFYNRLDDLKNGDFSEQELLKEYQKFISKSLFEGRDVALTPHRRDKVVKVKIGSESERAIHDLGDGVQAALILSFLPFIQQDQNTFFFIEEPEMFLHPGLQRKILDFYSSLGGHLFFLTTHSNHFLDITIDIKQVAIFTFRKPKETTNFVVERVDSGCDSSLGLLGVRNSSVFLVNATIWVEGITDRWYLREMLQKYMDYLDKSGSSEGQLEEDVHYSFVEYGGANITHWSFLNYEDHPIEVKRLCSKAILLIDKDGDKKMSRKADLQRLLGSRLVQLECREVENLLPYQVIKAVVLDYEKNPKLVVDEYNYDDFRDEYLGTFIEEKVLKGKYRRKAGYAAESGTLKDKVKFCEKSLPKIEYEALPPSTQEVIQTVYEFVRDQNK